MSDPSSKETLLPRLFDLMEKSDDIRGLPLERKDRIRDKYRRATEAAIRNGILMLEKNISDKDAEHRKSAEALKKNSERLIEARISGDRERAKSARLADQMLKANVTVSKKKRSSRLKFVFVILLFCAAGFLVWYFMLK